MRECLVTPLVQCSHSLIHHNELLSLCRLRPIVEVDRSRLKGPISLQIKTVDIVFEPLLRVDGEPFGAAIPGPPRLSNSSFTCMVWRDVDLEH